MKKLFVTSLSIFGLVLTAFAPVNGNIRLLWDYPPEELEGTTFNIYHTTNLGNPNWTILTNTSATQIDLVILPGANFFTVTASNFWGETDFSNVASTPATPRNDVNLRITKLL